MGDFYGNQQAGGKGVPVEGWQFAVICLRLGRFPHKSHESHRPHPFAALQVP